MDRNIGPTIEHRLLHLAGEDPLSPHLGQSRSPVAISEGRDFDDLYLAVRISRDQQVTHMPRLPQREPTGPRRQSECRR